MEVEFEGWPPCDVCSEPVDEQTGVISLNTWAALQRRRGFERWKEEHLVGDDRSVDLGQLATMPEHVPWVWSHVRCEPKGVGYDIAATRFNTLAKAFGWTLQLLEKQWFDPHAWKLLVRRFYKVPYP